MIKIQQGTTPVSGPEWLPFIVEDFSSIGGAIRDDRTYLALSFYNYSTTSGIRQHLVKQLVLAGEIPSITIGKKTYALLLKPSCMD